MSRTQYANPRMENAPAPLAAALRDLEEALDEAAEEDFPTPQEAAFDNARRLLRAMYAISPRRFEVYPTPDGEIAIDAPDGRGSSVLLLCDSDGGALCLVNMKGRASPRAVFHRRGAPRRVRARGHGGARAAGLSLKNPPLRPRIRLGRLFLPVGFFRPGAAAGGDGVLLHAGDGVLLVPAPVGVSLLEGEPAEQAIQIASGGFLVPGVLFSITHENPLPSMSGAPGASPAALRGETNYVPGRHRSPIAMIFTRAASAPVLPISSRRTRGGSSMGSSVRSKVPQCMGIIQRAPRSRSARSPSAGFM